LKAPFPTSKLNRFFQVAALPLCQSFAPCTNVFDAIPAVWDVPVLLLGVSSKAAQKVADTAVAADICPIDSRMADWDACIMGTKTAGTIGWPTQDVGRNSHGDGKTIIGRIPPLSGSQVEESARWAREHFARILPSNAESPFAIRAIHEVVFPLPVHHWSWKSFGEIFNAGFRREDHRQRHFGYFNGWML
jgi:hypothetical protein